MTRTINYPAALKKGDRIAVTAPSSGVSYPLHRRLDLVLGNLRTLGFEVIEGQCLRNEIKNASASQEVRAKEFNQFLHDPSIAAIFPPWGGELATELLDQIDFESLRLKKPKWLLGFSDISTLQLPLLLQSGWASAYGSNLMDLIADQSSPLTRDVIELLSSDQSQHSLQFATEKHQVIWTDFADVPDIKMNLTEPTVWKRLDESSECITFSGRLIGGCLDTICGLAGTRFGEVPKFVQENQTPGVILYFENCELNPVGLVRTLLTLKRCQWFENLNGLLIGRSSGPDAKTTEALSYKEALNSVLGKLAYPVLYDTDIGHVQPQMTLVNGAIATVQFHPPSQSLCSISQQMR
jgi:muramoyltetrapeptide carboxypeptidase